MAPVMLEYIGLAQAASSRMSTTVITHASCQQHDMGADHPESPQRIHAITGYLRRTGLAQELRWRTALPASREQVLAVHPESHFQHIVAQVPARGLAMLDGDTLLCPHSLDAALHAAGAATQAVDAVLSGDTQTAFCAVRPPGHHAEQNQAMGFCVFNNVAVGVRHAQQHWNLKRVAVLDFDVHHGNGTVDIFQGDPDVLVCSSFQFPLFPGRLQDLRRPQIINTPLPAGTRSTAFRKALERDWIPALEAHRPEIIFVSAGFDAHREDPLAQLMLEDADYRWLGELIRDQSKIHAQGRTISLLEGGYHLDALARSVQEYLEGLSGF